MLGATRGNWGLGRTLRLHSYHISAVLFLTGVTSAVLDSAVGSRARSVGTAGGVADGLSAVVAGALGLGADCLAVAAARHARQVTQTLRDNAA